MRRVFGDRENYTNSNLALCDQFQINRKLYYIDTISKQNQNHWINPMSNNTNGEHGIMWKKFVFCRSLFIAHYTHTHTHVVCIDY